MIFSNLEEGPSISNTGLLSVYFYMLTVKIIFFVYFSVNVGLFCSTPAVAVGRAVPRKVAMEMLFTGHPISAQGK